MVSIVSLRNLQVCHSVISLEWFHNDPLPTTGFILVVEIWWAKHIQKCSVSQSISVPVLLALASNYFCWIQQTTNQPTRQPLPNSKRIAWKLINSLCRTGCLCCFCCLQLRSKPVSSVSAMFRSLFHDDLCLSLCISCHHALHGTFWHSLRQTNIMKYLLQNGC